MKFTVLRQHQGDKFYKPGDLRDATEADVQHLIRSGVLAKADDAPQNKAEPAAEANKAEARADDNTVDKVDDNTAEASAPRNKSRKRKA